MKLTTVQKIALGIGGAVVIGASTALIVRSVRRKRSKENIYKRLQDVTTVEGQAAVYDEEDTHKALLGFDPNFWKRTTGSPLPDHNLMMRSMDAREIAREIESLHGFSWSANRWESDQDKMLAILKQKVKSQGALSQVAHAYQSEPLAFGSFADDVGEAMESSYIGSKNMLPQLNMWAKNLPY